VYYRRQEILPPIICVLAGTLEKGNLCFRTTTTQDTESSEGKSWDVYDMMLTTLRRASRHLSPLAETRPQISEDGLRGAIWNDAVKRRPPLRRLSSRCRHKIANIARSASRCHKKCHRNATTQKDGIFSAGEPRDATGRVVGKQTPTAKKQKNATEALGQTTRLWSTPRAPEHQSSRRPRKTPYLA
jgi:hypothetical protein